MGIREADLFRGHGLDYPGPADIPRSIFEHDVWAKIECHEGHWIWLGTHGSHGPEIAIGAYRVMVVRFLFEMCEHRDLTPDEIMTNACGRKRCVFPLHWPPRTRSALMREVKARAARGALIHTPSAQPADLSTSRVEI